MNTVVNHGRILSHSSLLMVLMNISVDGRSSMLYHASYCSKMPEERLGINCSYFFRDGFSHQPRCTESKLRQNGRKLQLP